MCHYEGSSEQENLKSNRTHQVVACADGNLLSENMNTTYCREKSVVGRLVE